MVNWHVGEDFEITLARYARYLFAQGYRESSVERYERLVRGFLKFANASHPNISQADDYRNHLLDLRQSPATINNACFAISHFFEMHGEAWKCPILPVHNAIPHFFTEEEVHKIFEAARQISRS